MRDDFPAKGGSASGGKNLKPSELEEEILKFWQENKIFEKSVQKPASKLPKADYVFYDGPPFATGLPHYGHILTSIIKDVIPRYQTMKGKRVERRWGWDCHGLPIENEIEKDLGLKTKKDIENIGIKTFNEAARLKVSTYAFDWKKIIPRIGRWIDMENDYKTMDVDYMESVLWVFKKLYDKGLVYNDFRVAPYCPRCGTSLSNFELNQPGAYKDVEDQSIYVKLPITNYQLPNTYFLVWTTTPWTLPANAALAVGSKINYVRVKIGKEKFVLAKERLSVLNEPHEIEKEFSGKDLVGLRYEPLYKSKTPALPAGKQNLTPKTYQVVAADFVSAEDGTGIVHIAPAFGEDDMKVGRKENLPTIITVDREGRVIKGLNIPGEGFFVKKADGEIKANLKNRGLLYKEEKIIHSYPHCWRCETPLLYYPINAWYIAVAKIKNRLIKNNQKINWIPSHIKNGRFGKWLKEARDWDVSRLRFWGAPIPVWKCQGTRINADKHADKCGNVSRGCGKIKVIGSTEEIKKNIKKSGNKYFVMRHGEAESNAKNTISSSLKTSSSHPLTEKGRKQALNSLKKLALSLPKGIDLVFSSDFLRTKETAEIAAAESGLNKSKIIYDKRLREVNTGIFDAKNPKDYHKYFSSFEERFYKTPPKGENLTDLKKRVAEFLYEIEKKYSNKNILIISHEYPSWLLFAGAAGADFKKAIAMRGGRPDFIKIGEIQKLNFIPLPHNDDFELDFHRPYIDEIEFSCVCGGKMKRIPDVFDCWFESGSMPYGQAHYPFENKKKFEQNFPAEFIAEGTDQTRGWFYTLLVLSTGLFNKPAYKNVAVNGIILAENGQKMSKRLKNYPDPMEIVSKYGADALRYYFLSSSAMRAEDLNFSEKGVDEVYKKVILRLWNVYKFYEMYAQLQEVRPPEINRQYLGGRTSQKLNVLDKWIIIRLEELKSETSKWLDKYELDKAVQPIGDFIDDLSTWYIRRSRERFKIKGKDKQNAVATTKFVLGEFSKIIAPFMPFMAEGIYLAISDKRKAKSVHLEEWPKKELRIKNYELRIIEEMAEVRKICSLGLEARQKAGIKVRQPLQKLKTKSLKLKVNKELLEVLADEINVKEIIFDKKIKEEIELDTKITKELKEEGMVRELTRGIQDLRKKVGLNPQDKIELLIDTEETGKKLIKNFEKEIKKGTNAAAIEFSKNDGGEIRVEELKFKIKIQK